MIVYHRTSKAAALTIRKSGFRDGENQYLRAHMRRGVWVSDRDPDREAEHQPALFEIDLPDAVFAEYEWATEGAGYREALVPASVLNACSRQLSIEGAPPLDGDCLACWIIAGACIELRHKQPPHSLGERLHEIWGPLQSRWERGDWKTSVEEWEILRMKMAVAATEAGYPIENLVAAFDAPRGGGGPRPMRFPDWHQDEA